MRQIILFIVVIVAIVGVSARRLESHVVWDTPDGLSPAYMVSLRAPSHFCAGSIINKRWILTTANCIIGFSAKTIKVSAGIYRLNETGDSYQADLVLPHPKFTNSSFTNDVGLIHVNRDITFGPNVRPIELPNKDFVKENYPVYFTGWGTTSPTSSLSDSLQQITLKSISQKSCNSSYGFITEEHICTLTKIGEGICYGDGGGPLMADCVQIGIASIGRICATGYPDVFTKVWTFIDWIEEYIQL